MSHSKRYVSEGFILRKRNHSEADRIITIYSKHYGKLNLIAKSIRKTSSRKRGHVEVFNHIKFSAYRSKGMDLLLEVESLQEYVNRKNLRKSALNYFVCECVDKLASEKNKIEGLYELIGKYFDLVNKSSNLLEIKNQFIQELLILLGYLDEKSDISDPERFIEDITERKLTTIRVGRRMFNS